MRQERTATRPRGTGCLLLRQDKAGRETWYGKLEVTGRSVERSLHRGDGWIRRKRECERHA